MHEHRELEDLEKYPERRAVYDALRQLHREGHPHLHQYVATVVTPSGMTLREAAAVLGLSHQRVGQIRDVGLAQISKSGKLDLSYWPVLPKASTRTLRNPPIQADMLYRLRRLNVDAKNYRRGQDPQRALAFYRAVKRLHEAGISYRAMARALGEKERTFQRRCARWGVTESYGRRRRVDVPIRVKQGTAEIKEGMNDVA